MLKIVSVLNILGFVIMFQNFTKINFSRTVNENKISTLKINQTKVVCYELQVSSQVKIPQKLGV